MPAAVRDFRGYAFDLNRVDASGKSIGRNIYWKLYAIENTVRILIHSVLTVQVMPLTDWWLVTATPQMKKAANDRKSDYAQSPWHGTPGNHPVYYIFLSDLKKIIVATRHFFLPIVPDIDNWIARLDQVRLPRNVVGHMNWPSARDAQRISLFHHDLQKLVQAIANAGKIRLEIPA